MPREETITLDKERGINPRLTYCPWCGGDSGEIALLGDQDYLFTCSDCKANFMGSKTSSKCPRCKGRNTSRERRLDESERIPGSLCSSCKEKGKACNEEVKAGGIHWRCRDCKSAGAIKRDHPLAKEVREQMKIFAPDPVGIEFSKEDCPACGCEAQTGQASRKERPLEGAS